MPKLNVENQTDEELMDLIQSMQMRWRHSKDSKSLLHISDEEAEYTERYLLFADELIRRGYQPTDQIVLLIWTKQ